MNWFSSILEWNWCKPKTLKRALWLWNLDFNKQAEFLKFCEEKKITDVYWCVGQSADSKKIKVFLEASKRLNLKVSYLVGEQVTNDTSSQWHLNLLEWAVTQGFEDFHLDYEISQGTTTGAYNKFLESVLTGIRSKTASLEVDVEWWRQDKEYFDIISKYCDSVTFMSYRTDSRGVAQLIKIGRRHLKLPFSAGIETGEDDKISDISFWNLGEEKLNNEIKNIENYFKWNKNFQGVAIHHYESYLKLKK